MKEFKERYKKIQRKLTIQIIVFVFLFIVSVAVVNYFIMAEVDKIEEKGLKNIVSDIWEGKR